MTRAQAAAMVLLATAMAGCQGGGGTTTPAPQVTAQPQAAPSPPAISRANPSRDEQACLQAVSIKTSNGDVFLLQGTETSQANTTVYIGVGPNRARWRCLVKNAVVAEVTSLSG